MAQLIDNNDRRLIPIWGAFVDTIAENGVLFPSVLLHGDIGNYLHEWNNDKNIANAADLLTASVINNQEDDENVREAAKFVLSCDNTPTPLICLSKTISDGFNDIYVGHHNINLYQSIAILKKSLQIYPYNAIAHIEIARCYLLLGQKGKAEQHIQYALFIDKNNRFVVRCSVRFYVHVGKVEQALWTIRKSCLVRKDPWLMAAEISLCQVLGKISSNIKRGYAIIESNNYKLFDLTELSSAIGMQEMLYGTYKKSRKLINMSLKAPNNNSLAQARWIVNKEPQLSFDFSKYTVQQFNFMEAECYEAFARKDYSQSLNFARQWMQQEPYSTRAILYAYNIALNYVRDLACSQHIMSEAIKTHKDNLPIINDYAYSLALDNKIEEAEKVIGKKHINKTSDEIKDICFTATCGLVYFRKGNIKDGTDCYISAIKRSLQHKESPEINHSAILNFCREILICHNGKEERDSVKDVLNRLTSKINKENHELQILLSDVEELLTRTTETNEDTKIFVWPDIID